MSKLHNNAVSLPNNILDITGIAITENLTKMSYNIDE